MAVRALPFPRRELLLALPIVAIGCAREAVPERQPRPGDRFRRVQLGAIEPRARHLAPIVPIFRAALVEALRRTRGVVDAGDEAATARSADTILVRGELADDASPLVAVATTARVRTLAGRFELLAPDDTVVQRFAGLQRYAGGPGVPAFSAQGWFDLAVEFGGTVAAAIGRWLEGGAAALPADSRTRNGEALTRAA
ncbi:MAG: hypothetical protein N3D77_01655 [Geminicoccaceae bacterium]|nr:hypothetical protein [Geminicoccaceae bacterium]